MCSNQDWFFLHHSVIGLVSPVPGLLLGFHIRKWILQVPGGVAVDSPGTKALQAELQDRLQALAGLLDRREQVHLSGLFEREIEQWTFARGKQHID